MIGALDLCVMNSRREPFGLILMEAMAMGTPVVSTDSGGQGELIRHGVEGELVKFGDQAELVRTIVRLAKDSDLRERYRGAGQVRIKECFTREKYVARWCSFYADLSRPSRAKASMSHSRTRRCSLIREVLDERNWNYFRSHARGAEFLATRRGSMRFTMYGVIVGVALLALFGGGAARYGIPVITTVAAYRLYRKSPPLYVSFVWWLFFLICFVRRIIDYRSGFSDVNIVIAAPYLAALVCTPTVFARSDVWRSRVSVPFILAFIASLYGLFVGVLLTPAKNLVVSGLAWFSPLIFGFYILTEMTSKSRRDEHFAALERTFSWGMLIMGCYGVYQFLTAPGWDALWMAETRMGSIGSPEPYGIRVFSTMNGPGALAYALTTGLLLLLVRRRAISLFSAAAGLSALLLSSVRAAWGTLAIMLGLFAFREKRYVGKLVTASGLLVGVALLAMFIQPLRERVEDRFASFTNMHDDTSYQERTSGYEEMLAFAAEYAARRWAGRS